MFTSSAAICALLTTWPAISPKRSSNRRGKDPTGWRDTHQSTLTADGTHFLLLDGSTRWNIEKSYRTPLDHPISNRVHQDVQLCTRRTDEVSKDSYCYRDSRHGVAHCRGPAEEEDQSRYASAGEHSGGYKRAVQSCSIRFGCAQTRNALGPSRHSQILRNRHEYRGRQDIGRFVCNRAGPANKSNYPRTGRISSATEL